MAEFPSIVVMYAHPRVCHRDYDGQEQEHNNGQNSDGQTVWAAATHFVVKKQEGEERVP